jgi:hypothetical protein
MSINEREALKPWLSLAEIDRRRVNVRYDLSE